MYILTGERLVGLGQPEPTGNRSTPSTSSTITVRSAVPKLVKPLSGLPALCTMYVDINLNPVREAYWNGTKKKWESKLISVTPMTGIFMPKNYIPKQTVDLILYLHGHKTPCKASATATINQFWEASKYFNKFREGVNDSGKNVILVAPTLGPKSGAGKLVKPGGFNTYLYQILAALNAHSQFAGKHFFESIGEIILACHSGGGKPMSQIVQLSPQTDSYITNIRECWGFDSLYQGSSAWANWASNNPNQKLYIYHRFDALPVPIKAADGSSVKAFKVNLNDLLQQKQKRKLNNIQIENSSTKDHCYVPIAHWIDRIKQAPLLSR